MNLLDVPSAVLTSALFSAPVSATLHAHGDAEPAAIALSDLGIGEFATIHAVLPAGDDAERELVMRLIEIGFVPGERVRVTAVGRPGREPIAVRLVGRQQRTRRRDRHDVRDASARGATSSASFRTRTRRRSDERRRDSATRCRSRCSAIRTAARPRCSTC